jgi:signal transduction histidine kinase
MDDSVSGGEETADVALLSLAGHLALSPVAFAITEGADHTLRNANAAFRKLESDGTIAIGDSRATETGEATDLRPLLDRAYSDRAVIRDELLASPAGDRPQLACTVWPIPADANTPERLVIELRDASYIEGALARQRAIAQRLLISALREQDTAREAVDAGRRSEFLASASRDLAMSLDLDGTRDIVSRRSLPREGTWCIVDVIESNGGLHRLAVIHPDPSKQALASTLAHTWEPQPGDSIGAASVATPGSRAPTVITHDSGEALEAAAHGPENLATLRKLGFGALLVVPLVIRATVIGAITFVTPYGDPPFTQDEITLASDLTDRCAMALENARLYQQSDALRARANTANLSKSEFLRNISHELRTPLNAIGGYAELIEMGLRGPVTTEQRTDLTRIRRSQRHLLSLISEILNFVRAESGRMEYRFAEVSIEAAIDDVVEMMEGSIERQHLDLERHPGEADVRVWADPDRMRQILINLVMNAIKYSPPGAGKISISYTMTRYDVIIQVADSGSGIPPDMLESIFEPFVQLDSGLTDRRGGVGLGLAISRDMARAMNGDLTVDSTMGMGSRFTLALPRAPHEEPLAPHAALSS